jgi:hypothetical protein
LRSKFLVNSAALAIPPPPQEAQRKPRKTLLAGIIVAIIVVAVVVTAVALTMNNLGTFSNTNPPSPGTISTPNPGQTNNVAGASSLKFSVTYTQKDSTPIYAYTFNAKNIGTQNMMFRVEGTFSSDSQNIIYIINGVQQKAWMYSGNQWTDLSDSFSDQWSQWDSLWNGYFNSLTNWSGIGDYTYTSPSSGDTLRLYDVQVNPQLPDSLFAP